MRPRRLVISSLLEALQGQPLVSSAELTEMLGVSQPTVSRGLAALGPRVVKIGRTRATQYGLARAIGRLGSHWPIYRIDEDGKPHELGTLHALQQGHWYFESDQDVESLRFGEFARGVFPDLPWFLDDQRPQGFLGRAFAQAHAEGLDAPPDILLWNGEHVLTALLSHGDNLPGNLVVGDASLERALQEIVRPTGTVRLSDRVSRFPEMAGRAILGQSVGSSAGGEQPKFTVCIDDGGGDYQSAIVKFSEPASTPSALRWADLLQCEHLAGKVLEEGGIPAARTHVVDSDSRRFLQSQRFDRTARLGRRGYVSLRSLDAAFYGRGRAPWSEMAQALQGDGWITAESARWMKIAGFFGDMIGNIDMHFGNIAFELKATRPLGWVPVFDMLPMLYAPTTPGAIVDREFRTKPPHTRTLAEWSLAAALAVEFWNRVSRDRRISEGFREIARMNQASVASMHHRFG